MHASELAAILEGTVGDVRWPPSKLEREAWERVADYRRRYRNDAGELFSYRPELHIAENAPATAARMATFTPAPLSRDLCRFSSQLLFSQPPRISLPEELAGEQPVLDEWLEFNRFSELLLDSGDAVAAEGECALRVVMDDHISSEVPIVTHHAADSLLWSVRHGRYTQGGVLSIEAEGEHSSVIWRLLEAHEPGVIRRRLFKGSASRLGHRYDLSSGPPQFRDLKPETSTGVDRPTLIRWQNTPGGDSDLAGLEALLDALDEACTIGVVKQRASQPITILREIPFGNLRSLGGLPMHNLISLDDSAGGTSPSGGFIQRHNSLVGSPFPVEKLVETSQPGLEAAEHRTYVEQVRELCISLAGYSLASWGLDREGRADSGTALKLRQVRTLLTRSGKELMAVQAIAEACGLAHAMITGRSEVGPVMPDVELSDGMPRDGLQDAEEALRLRSARAASTEQLVRKLHPEWREEEVVEEVARLESASEAPPAAPPQLRSIEGGT